MIISGPRNRIAMQEGTFTELRVPTMFKIIILQKTQSLLGSQTRIHSKVSSLIYNNEKDTYKCY